jgi:translation initiation factor IF-3
VCGPPHESPPAAGRSCGSESDTGGHISTEPRINERIRVPEVRLVGPNGEQVGIVAINDALRLAQEADLDLVEVAPTARPPVCKLMDYGKFKYESALKARESRKHQAQTVIKEIKLRPKIDPHDYGTKKGHVERFLRQGDKVKVTIMFRGREQSRPDLGYRLLQRLAGDVEELGFVEAQPKQDGRNMIMVIGPHKRKPDAKAERVVPARPRPRAAAPAGSSGPAGPSGPSAPSGPAGSSGPSAPSGPAGSSGPSAPSGPGGASGPSGPARPSAPSAPSGPGGASGPARPGRPSGPAGRPVPSPRPARPTAPTQPVAAPGPAEHGADAPAGT